MKNSPYLDKPFIPRLCRGAREIFPREVLYPPHSGVQTTIPPIPGRFPPVTRWRFRRHADHAADVGGAGKQRRG